MRINYFKWIIRITIVLAIVVGIFILAGRKKPLCDKCNVILVSLDTLSALHLPCYGYERNTAPNLCAFADKNITFLNSYSQTPTTLNSHFSIFTSLYPSTHKMTDIDGDPLNEKYLTLAQLLRANGYKTIYDGAINDPHLPLNRGIERGFNTVEGKTPSTVEMWNKAYYQFFDNLKSNIPTFLFLHTYSVHAPYLTGHKDKHLYTDQPENPNISLTVDEFEKFSLDLAKSCADILIKHENLPEGYIKEFSSQYDIALELKKQTDYNSAFKVFKKLSDVARHTCISMRYFSKVNKSNSDTIEYYKALYDEQIHNMDEKLADLFNLMSDPVISNNTILIITADHGEEFMEHGEIDHAKNLYRTSTAVPLIVHIPGVGPKKIKDLVQGIDIYPTVINLVGIYPKSKLEGLDLTGVIKGDKNAKTNKYILGQFERTSVVQVGDYRYYLGRQQDSTAFNELYDLSLDPQEKNNIASLLLKKTSELRSLIR